MKIFETIICYKLLIEPNSKNVINPPKNVQHTLYVDGINGRDWKDGKTEGTALKTLQKAMKNVQSGTQIIVKNGNYQNYKFGSGKKLLTYIQKKSSNRHLQLFFSFRK